MNPVQDLDDLLHAKARLGIMTLTVAEGEADFSLLKSRLELTDGNLGAHITILEKAGYVKVQKRFVGRKPKTTVHPTASGRKAFREYLEKLESVIRLARG